MQRVVTILAVVRQSVLDARFLYGIGGLFMSIVAHECFHLLMHLGEISGFQLFPNHSTVFAVIVNGSALQTTASEEAVAYAITIGILFMTVIDVFAIHDAMQEGRGTKSATAIVRAKRASLAQLDDAELRELLLKVL